MLAVYIAIALGIICLGLLGSLYIVSLAGSKLEDERNSLQMQVRRLTTELEAAHQSVKYVQGLLKEGEKKAQLAVVDAQQRIEESRTIPIVACMNDYQVSNLAVALGTFIKEILLGKKEYIN